MVHKKIISHLQRKWRRARHKASPIEVYALIGRAGTGKSFRARLVADAHQIDCILDDGLLIYQGKIIAGRSAKQESHYFTAVKTALFTDLKHRESVLHAIKDGGFQKILLLGTSDKMILRNCETLKLPTPSTIIRIEDIATTEEINEAIYDRKTHGKHIIPLPIIEVKAAYPRMVAHAIQVFFQKSFHRHERDHPYQKTVVHPSYHRKGDITISEAALTQMLMHCIFEKAPQITIRKIRLHQHQEGYRIKLRIRIPFGMEVASTCESLHHYMITQIEKLTGIKIETLSILIDTIDAKPVTPSPD